MQKKTTKTGNTTYTNPATKFKVTHVPGGAKHVRYTTKDGKTHTTRTPGKASAPRPNPPSVGGGILGWLFGRKEA